MENNLEIDVKNAKALGLSYGYYKAMLYDPSAPQLKIKKPVKVCPVCGKEVPPNRSKFDSDACAKSYTSESKRQRRRELYRLKKYKNKKEDE